MSASLVRASSVAAALLVLAAYFIDDAAAQDRADLLSLRAEPLLRSAEDRLPGSASLLRRYARELAEVSRNGNIDRNSGAFFSRIRKNLRSFGDFSDAQRRDLMRQNDTANFRLDTALARPDDLDFNAASQRNMRSLLRSVRAGERVIGGERVQVTAEFGSTVGLRNYGGGIGSDTICTGVLIEPELVLTAAHCVCDFDLDRAPLNVGGMRVVFGLEMPASAAELSASTRQIRPDGVGLLDPEFCDHLRADNQMWKGFDIALLRLDVPSDRRFEPAELVDTGLFLSRAVTAATVVGFGNTLRADVDFNVPEKFHAAIPFTSKLCNGRDGERRYVGCIPGREMVLYDWFFRSRDTCDGDSGGPAYVQDGGVYYLAGITSRGLVAGCGAGGVYTVLTDEIQDWIRQFAASTGRTGQGTSQ